MSANPNRTSNGWGHDDDRRDQVKSDIDATWIPYALAILLVIIAGTGFMIYRARQLQQVAVMQAIRAEEARQIALARQAAEKASKEAQGKVRNATQLESTKEVKATPAEATPEKTKKIWPGMWLMGRDGEAKIHIISDRSRESCVGELLEFLKDNDPGIREDAAGWLGAIGRPAKDALPELRKLLKDADTKVRNAAEDAIKKIESGKDTDD